MAATDGVALFMPTFNSLFLPHFFGFLFFVLLLLLCVWNRPSTVNWKSAWHRKLNAAVADVVAEPNLLSHTAHSISRKGVKKRDLSDIELRDILSDILPHVRTDHILPKDSDVLTSAIKRGLVSIPPSHMIGSDTVAVGGQSSASAWVRTRNMALFIKPRLFVPYFDEVKVRLSLVLVLFWFVYRLKFGSWGKK